MIYIICYVISSSERLHIRICKFESGRATEINRIFNFNFVLRVLSIRFFGFFFFFFFTELYTKVMERYVIASQRIIRSMHFPQSDALAGSTRVVRVADARARKCRPHFHGPT